MLSYKNAFDQLRFFVAGIARSEYISRVTFGPYTISHDTGTWRRESPKPKFTRFDETHPRLFIQYMVTCPTVFGGVGIRKYWLNKVRIDGNVGWDYISRWENLHGSMVLLVQGAKGCKRILIYMKGNVIRISMHEFSSEANIPLPTAMPVQTYYKPEEIRMMRMSGRCT